MSKNDEPKVVFTPHDLDARVTELWRSGRQVLVLEGAEESRYKTAIKNAAATITKERDTAAKADGNTSKPVRMIAHDRWGGFYTGLPDIVPSPDKKSPVLANALQMAMFTKEEIERHFGREYLEPSTDPNKPNLVKLPFDPAEDLIFVFNSFESEVQSQQLTQTLIRKIMSANACSPNYIKDKAEPTGVHFDEALGGYPGFTRGTRMIIFVSPIGDFPNTIPELKPEIVPLPDFNALEECVLDAMEYLFDLYVETKGKKGAKKPEEAEWEMMVNSGKGMTCADFEEAVSLAWTRILSKFKADKRTGGIPFDEKDIAFFLNIIEKEKAKALAKIPGLTYVPKEQIVDSALPGYESVVDWIRTRQKVSRSKAKKRGVTPIRGLTLGGMPGIGKCLGKGTPVLMYNGTIKKVEDVVVGDLLMGPDSNPRHVLSLARGREMMYRVTPVKGDPYEVNESHILSLKTSPAWKGQERSIVNIPVKDYLNLSEGRREHLKGWRTGVDWPCRPQLIDPYVLGVWLGNGRNSGPAFTINRQDEAVIEKLWEYATQLDLNFTSSDPQEECITYHIVKDAGGDNYNGNVLLENLRSLNLIDNKHIPIDYLATDFTSRMQLLAGLLDTDGYMANNCYEISTVYERLADNIVFLARSLGFAASCSDSDKVCTNNGAVGHYWRVLISGNTDEIPVLSERKVASPRQQKKDVLVTGITVDPIGEGDYFGFTIDGDHLFMLGDFTVTHNTEFAKYLAYLTGRTCGIWDTGASKGSHVGDTEKNTKLVMQVARAIDMLVLCDDIDKGSISKSRDYSGDGGTSGNQVQMLLTDMSDPSSNVIWVFTFNRVPNLPEIMRMGRIDKQYIVDRPNAETRLGILKNHIARSGMTIDDEEGLKTLASDAMTKDWTGAELAHRLVKEEVFRAMAEESEELQVDRMIDDTKGFTPMVHQKTFADDIKEMEEACSQFEHIGNRRIETVVGTGKNGASRSRRATAAA